jgi:hypothetical protein
MCLGLCEERLERVRVVAGGPLRSLDLTPETRAAMAEALRRRAERVRERVRAIEALCARAAEEGGVPDRGYWAMIHDFEMAPPTNGRTMLLEAGIVPIPPQDLREDAHLHEALWTLIEGLAASRVYLLNTDHLGDRQLYERLFYKILDERTHCLPPDSAACEYIDVLHPMDIQSGGPGAELHRRLVAGTHPAGERRPGVRAPPQAHPVCDRDRHLPRPAE